MHCVAVVMFSFDLTINGKMVNSYATNCSLYQTIRNHVDALIILLVKNRTLIQVCTGRIDMRTRMEVYCIDQIFKMLSVRT